MADRLDADVIVAGAGPAGSAAAAHLRAAGVDVTVVERGRFPRDKICGDFVGPVALAELAGLGAADLPELLATNAVERAGLFADGRRLITYALPRVAGLPHFGRVVPRAVFDAALAGVARRAGARLIEGASVCGFALRDRCIEVRVRDGASEERLRARVLVGADGSGSQVARELEGRAPARDEFIVAVRAYFEGVAGPQDRCDLSFTSQSFPGYAWVFPIGQGVANVGVGMVADTFGAPGENMHTLLARLLQRDLALHDRLAGARQTVAAAGWPLRIYAGRTLPAAKRVVLIGDAAGLVNPLNGEGIATALCSARWAAESIAAALASDSEALGGLGCYATRLRRELALDMLLARSLVRAIANRALNPLWLAILRAVVARAARDRCYADATGGVVAGVVRAREAFTTAMLVRSAETLFAEFTRACAGGPAALAHIAGSGAVPVLDVLLRPREAAHWWQTVAEAARDVLAAYRAAHASD